MEGRKVRVVDDDAGDEPGPWNSSRGWRVAAVSLTGFAFVVALLVLALNSAEEPPSNLPEAAPATTRTTGNVGNDSEPLPRVNQRVDGGDPMLRCVADAAPVIDNAPLREGLYTLRRAATSLNGFKGESEAQIWIADCERESNLVADADDIAVEISTIDASSYSNLIYLDGPTEVFIGVDGSGESVTIEDVGTGTVLIFRIDVWECASAVWSDVSCRDTGNSYYSGPGSNNGDGEKYALQIPDGRATWVFFEDIAIGLHGEADEQPNYVDAIFTVSPASP